MLKRILDVMAASLGLLVLTPLLFLIVVAIRLDSRGPVLFRQQRVGRNRVPFAVLKFRTMVHRDSIDQRAEAVVESGSDARITRVGRVLRASSLDELPQLVNVLNGEMSLVGPRPILPEQLEVVPDRYMGRFAVRPGITGLAQVSGRRSLDWMKQLEYDTQYARSAGIVADIPILLRTVKIVFAGAGVYADSSKNWRAYRQEMAESKRPEGAP